MRLAIFAFFLLIGCAHLQRTPIDELQPFEYGFKTSMSKADQYQRSLLWMANNYKNIGAVISYTNANLGAIRGHSRVCLYRADGTGTFCATYNIDIDCK